MTNQLKDTLRVFVVPTEILDEDLNIYEKMTYMVLRSYANGQDDTAFPSYNTIATKGSMSKRKAIDCVKKLVELGFVGKKKRKKVSVTNGISDTSNLYTIYRPAEVKRKEDSACDALPPSACDAPPLVHDMHNPCAPDAPEKNYLKELDLKQEEEEEEEIITSDDVILFINKQLTKRQITNEKTIRAVSEVVEQCKAIGTSDRKAMQNYCITVIEDKMKKFGQKQGTKKRTGTVKKAIREEIVPEWLHTNDADPQKKQPTKEGAAISEERKKAIWEQVEKMNAEN